jgi:hypothetical protein
MMNSHRRPDYIQSVWIGMAIGFLAAYLFIVYESGTWW